MAARGPTAEHVKEFHCGPIIKGRAKGALDSEISRKGPGSRGKGPGTKGKGSGTNGKGPGINVGVRGALHGFLHWSPKGSSYASGSHHSQI